MLDLKPSVPFADAVPEARGGFVEGEPERLRVEVSAEAREGWAQVPEEEQRVMLETLALDGRPAYHEETQEGRVYHLRVGAWEVDWEVRGGGKGRE